MPPLPGMVTSPSPSLVPVIQGRRDKGKAPDRHPPRRLYSDEPLPVRPNSDAPKNARIVGREQAHDGGRVGYKLKIGEIEVNDVGADEILDYVSAFDLEQFEMLQFREEAQIWKALEEDQEVKRRFKLARAAERARTKGAVMVEEGSDSDGLGGFAQPDEDDVQFGKHGRARPDYSKFYKPPVGFRGKGKDAEDVRMGNDSMQTDDEGPSASRAGAQQVQQRRRRRRDPATGELLPLYPAPRSPSPPVELEKTKRPRRKRHPLTGELMPLGWKYNPEAEGKAYESRRMGLDPTVREPSFKRLSISEPQAKRPRLDTESATSNSMSPVPSKAEIMGQAASQSTPKGGRIKASATVVDLMSSEDEPQQVVSIPRLVKSPAKQPGNSMMQGTMKRSAETSDDDSSPEPGRTTSMMRPSASQQTPKAQQGMTSIMSPSGARASSIETPAAGLDDEESDEDGHEWFIESIQDHRMSDPETHPAELNKQPVVLYSVKWEGFHSPTWEPMDSFGDRSFVDAYRKKVGLKALPKDDSDGEEETVQVAELVPEKQTPAPASRSEDAIEDEDEEVYDLEKIVSHHLSDPRTHPKALGKKQVMLYQVRWKGWEETTWEPEDSFDDDPKPLIAYKKKHGLR